MRVVSTADVRRGSWTDARIVGIRCRYLGNLKTCTDNLGAKLAWTTEKISSTQLRAVLAAANRGEFRSKTKKLSDGKGLQFWLTPEGGRYWRMEYRFGGKRKLLAFGTYPEVSMADARRKAEAARANIQAGFDPSDVKRQKKLADKAMSHDTFAKVAAALIRRKTKAGRAKATIDKMEWIVKKVDAKLGHRPIMSITVQEITAVLRKEENADNLETARRMRTVMGEVFRYAMQQGIANHDPVHATRGAIASPKPKHLAAIVDAKAFGAMLNVIDEHWARNNLVSSSLQLLALLYPRPGELRQANWQEFNLKDGLWTIPAERTKLRQEHMKPLSRQALRILHTVAEQTGPVGFVFPAVGKNNRPMSENTLNLALKRWGITNHVPHGFRASASTLLNASNKFSVDAIERSLAHQDSDAVRRAYARGDAMTERRIMAQWWADYLDRIKAGSNSSANILSAAL